MLSQLSIGVASYPSDAKARSKTCCIWPMKRFTWVKKYDPQRVAARSSGACLLFDFCKVDFHRNAQALSALS